MSNDPEETPPIVYAVIPGERGPQGDHGQDGGRGMTGAAGRVGEKGRAGSTGARGIAGADAVTLDRLPLTVLLVVLTLILGFLIWRDHQLTDQLNRVTQDVVQLQDQVHQGQGSKRVP